MEPTRTRSHRDDLQGLRALAVLLVVLSHAHVPGVQGGFVGVDVFFVLSGFLITGLLLSDAYRGEASIINFYKRRARRILPAATLTLVATMVAAYELLNLVRARQVLTDGLWASVFAANIHFARIGTNYFARAQPPSPLLHFWTLAVEEQFYLVWPALLIGLLTLRFRSRSGRWRLGLRPTPPTARRLVRITVAAAAITLASLVWSVHEGGATSSYFSTFSRAWELGLGALLAIATGQRSLPSRLRTLLGWGGIAAILSAGFFYSSATPFPGYAALLPTVGAAAVIAAGLGGTSGAGRLLAMAPFRYIGDRSYALYLWHWPILIVAADRAGHPLSVSRNLALVVVAFGVSIVSYRFYENPIRRYDFSGQGSMVVASSSVAVVIAFFAVFSSRIDGKLLALAKPATASGAPVAPNVGVGAASRISNLMKTAGSTGNLALPAVSAAVRAADQGAPIPRGLTPPIGGLLHSEYKFPAGCAPRQGQTSSSVCRLADTTAHRLLVVFGDSHAQMWMPAILALGEREGWTVVPLTKSGCTPPTWQGQHATGECNTWYQWAIAQTLRLRPKVVLVGGGINARAPGEVNAGSFTARLAGPDRRVILIGDAPKLDRQPVDCLLADGATMKTCTQAWPQDADRRVAEAAQSAGAGFIDPLSWFCARGECPMVVGHTIVYQDTGHATAEYVQALAAPFRAAFDRALASATGRG